MSGQFSPNRMFVLVWLGFTFPNGEVSERFKEHAWKACVGETRPWVRIPPSPPFFHTSPCTRADATARRFLPREWRAARSAILDCVTGQQPGRRTTTHFGCKYR